MACLEKNKILLGSQSIFNNTDSRSFIIAVLFKFIALPVKRETANICRQSNDHQSLIHKFSFKVTLIMFCLVLGFVLLAKLARDEKNSGEPNKLLSQSIHHYSSSPLCRIHLSNI